MNQSSEQPIMWITNQMNNQSCKQPIMWTTNYVNNQSDEQTILWTINHVNNHPIYYQSYELPIMWTTNHVNNQSRVRVGAGRLGENVGWMIWRSWSWMGSVQTYVERPHIGKNVMWRDLISVKTSYTTKFIYVLRRFDDFRHLHQELWLQDVCMVIKES